VPRSQTLRRPFFNSTVVSVAVAIEERVAVVFSSNAGAIPSGSLLINEIR
jgi:hypothetical protein